MRFQEPEPSPRQAPQQPATQPDISQQQAPLQALTPQVPSQPSPAISRPVAVRPVQMSDDEATASENHSDCAASSIRGPTAVRRKKRRTPRKTTTYLLAHPAPRPFSGRLPVGISCGGIQIRPKLLLQLQLLSPDRRPVPTVDVYPSSLIAGPGSLVGGGGGLSKRFPRLFRSRGELGLHDIVLLQSEDYELGARGESDDEDAATTGQRHQERELIAVLSPTRRDDETELVLADGSVWVASPLHNGSFEFVHVDSAGHTTVARWVRRAVPAQAHPAPLAEQHQPQLIAASGLSSPSPTPSPTQDYRLTFSLIDPQSRRHPILATLANGTLDILERYTTVSASAGRYPPSAPIRSSHQAGEALTSDDEEQQLGREPAKPERTSLPVDEATKTLITVSAVWVALRLGWSPFFRQPTSAELLAAATATATVNNSAASLSSASGTPTSSRSRSLATTSGTVAGGTVPGGMGISVESQADGRQATPDSFFAVRSGSKKRDASPAASLTASTRANTPSSVPSGVPRRAVSSGAAFVERRRATLQQRQQQQQQQLNSAIAGKTTAGYGSIRDVPSAANTDVSDAESGAVGRGARRRGRALRALSGEWSAAVEGLRRSLSATRRTSGSNREAHVDVNRASDEANGGAAVTAAPGTAKDVGGHHYHLGLHLPHLHFGHHHSQQHSHRQAAAVVQPPPTAGRRTTSASRAAVPPSETARSSTSVSAASHTTVESTTATTSSPARDSLLTGAALSTSPSHVSSHSSSGLSSVWTGSSGQQQPQDQYADVHHYHHTHRQPGEQQPADFNGTLAGVRAAKVRLSEPESHRDSATLQQMVTGRGHHHRRVQSAVYHNSSAVDTRLRVPDISVPDAMSDEAAPRRAVSVTPTAAASTRAMLAPLPPPSRPRTTPPEPAPIATMDDVVVRVRESAAASASAASASKWKKGAMLAGLLRRFQTGHAVATVGHDEIDGTPRR